MKKLFLQPLKTQQLRVPNGFQWITTTYLSLLFSTRQNSLQILGLNCQNLHPYFVYAFFYVHVEVHNKMIGLLRHSIHYGRINEAGEGKAWQKAISVAWSSWLITWLSVEKICNCVVYSKGYMPTNYTRKSPVNNKKNKTLPFLVPMSKPAIFTSN